MRTRWLLLLPLALACSGGSVEERRRELCRELCQSWRCDPEAGAVSADDGCVQSCYNTANPGAAACLPYLEDWLKCSRAHGPVCGGAADPCRAEQCASGTCDSCQGCRVTCPAANMCVTSGGTKRSCD